RPLIWKQFNEIRHDRRNSMLYNVKILALEAGNTEMLHDDLKASVDHTALKIELRIC
ncbi:1402_t:CDS:1, partial [Cetraspora pellucida]